MCHNTYRWHHEDEDVVAAMVAAVMRHHRLFLFLGLSCSSRVRDGGGGEACSFEDVVLCLRGKTCSLRTFSKEQVLPFEEAKHFQRNRSACVPPRRCSINILQSQLNPQQYNLNSNATRAGNNSSKVSLYIEFTRYVYVYVYVYFCMQKVLKRLSM